MGENAKKRRNFLYIVLASVTALIQESHNNDRAYLVRCSRNSLVSRWKSKMNKAIFLDRDGTINIEKDYMYKPEDFEFIPGVENAIERFMALGFKIIIITNQSGIARGYYTEDDLMALHEFINKKIRMRLPNVGIDAFYYCPHHPQGAIEKYSVECNCRKPKKGLFEQAIYDFNINIKLSWAVGDRVRDIGPAVEIGMNGALVLTGYSRYKDSSGRYIVVENLNILADILTKNAYGKQS